MRRTKFAAGLRNAPGRARSGTSQRGGLPTIHNVLVRVHSSSVQFLSLEREARTHYGCARFNGVNGNPMAKFEVRNAKFEMNSQSRIPDGRELNSPRGPSGCWQKYGRWEFREQEGSAASSRFLNSRPQTFWPVSKSTGMCRPARLRYALLRRFAVRLNGGGRRVIRIGGVSRSRRAAASPESTRFVRHRRTVRRWRRKTRRERRRFRRWISFLRSTSSTGRARLRVRSVQVRQQQAAHMPSEYGGRLARRPVRNLGQGSATDSGCRGVL